MCGRVRCALRVDDITKACYRSNGPVRALHMDRYRPSYKDDESAGEGVVVHCMKWGLIPSFTKKTEKPDHRMVMKNDPYSPSFGCVYKAALR